MKTKRYEVRIIRIEDGARIPAWERVSKTYEAAEKHAKRVQAKCRKSPVRYEIVEV